MLSVSSLIEFLMNLLRDEAAQAEFEQDPHGMLARHGLDGLCGQDVRDVAPMVADHESVSTKGGQHPGLYSGSATDDDPVQEITHLRENYEVNNTIYVNDSDEYYYTYIDDRDTIVNVDDRDTTTIIADGDVTIEDSFNQDNDVSVTQIEDSFNQDNDGVDNKGGTIDDSVVAGDDIEGSLNETDNSVNDSGNTDNSVDDSANTDNSVNDSANTTGSVNDNDVIDDDSSQDGAVHTEVPDEEIPVAEEEPVGVA